MNQTAGPEDEWRIYMEDTPTGPTIRVPLIEEEDATGETAELYAQVKERTGLPFVPDMFRLASSDPRLMKVVIAGFSGVFAPSTLEREVKEIVASWTSKLNGCPYCVGTHSWFLEMFGGSEELVAAIRTADNVEELPLDDKTMVLMRLVTKVSINAYKITDKDWKDAEDAGWTNAQCLDAVFVASMFAFINRLVDSTGLGSSVTRSRISQLPTG